MKEYEKPRLNKFGSISQFVEYLCLYPFYNSEINAYEIPPELLKEQRISFAFGNTAIKNPRITRDLVERVAEKMEKEKWQI